jgi:UPF0755 protein
VTDDLPPAKPPPPPLTQRVTESFRSRRRLYLAGAVLVALALAAMIFLAPWFPRSRGEGAEQVAVVIEQGDSLARAAEKLEEAGVISSADRFTLLARLLGGGGSIKTGEFAFYPSDGWSQHLATLQSGESIRRMVVIPEGMPAVLVHERLMGAEHLTGEVAVPEEGSVLPASYDYRRGETRAALLGRMQAAMREELARLWAQRKPTSFVRSPQEAIILAAIVEKETGKAEERRRIAGVYTNRLRQGMKLDADPTVIYPITRGRPLGRRILRSELQADTGYNTYARPGLPIGPIANPGREAIAAVLDPEQHDFLYFVADGTGGHVFARTLAEHQANVERWYAIRRQRGEM